MTELPSTWIDVAIGEIAEVISGGTPKANDTENFTAPSDGISWLTPADLSGYKAKEIAHGARDLTVLGYQSCSAKLMPKGSLLFSSRAPIGYVAIAANEISTNQGFKSFVFTDEIDPSYAFYYLKSIRQLADSLGTGTTFKELSGAAAKTLPFRLAPTTEQTRIAAKLDELLTQVDTLKARIDGIPALLKRFRHSVLAAAVSGRLTEEWRDMHGVKLAEPKSVGELAELVTKGASPKWQGIHYVEDSNQTLFVTSENVRSMNFDLTQEKYVEDKFNSLQGRSILAFGDVLTNIVGASIGRAAVWRSDRKANTNQAVCIIRTKKEALLPDYLSYYLNSPLGILSLTSEAVDVARANVSLAAVKGLQILAPELEEQTEIVRRVEQLFAFADQLEVRVKAAQARIDRLTQSILAKAFRGELVPQDPNDEPASVLLERIKAQRAAEPKVKRGRGAAKLS